MRLMKTKAWCINAFMQDFIQTYNISEDALNLLCRLVALLTQWQQKFNLVSRSSLENVWHRHIADSYQLYKFIPPSAKNVYDIGSGAGFPAIVLAIISLVDKRKTQFKLIESITKKTVYLNAIKEALVLENVEIINARSESLHLKPADFITARAVANLNKLFALSYPLTDLNTVLIFPKGKTFAQELREAKKYWSFDVRVVKNEVEPEGVVLEIRKLRQKK